jgi:hypothetical protein
MKVLVQTLRLVFIAITYFRRRIGCYFHCGYVFHLLTSGCNSLLSREPQQIGDCHLRCRGRRTWRTAVDGGLPSGQRLPIGPRRFFTPSSEHYWYYCYRTLDPAAGASRGMDEFRWWEREITAPMQRDTERRNSPVQPIGGTSDPSLSIADRLGQPRSIDIAAMAPKPRAQRASPLRKLRIRP